MGMPSMSEPESELNPPPCRLMSTRLRFASAVASGVMMIPVPASGVLEKIDGEEDAGSVAHITDLQITARLHDYIAGWPEGSSYLGFLFARAEQPAQVEAALRAAHSCLNFSITPRLPVEHPATRRMVG